MMKAFTFFAFIFAGTSLMVALLSGGGGLKESPLTMNITSSETSIPVTSATGYSASGVVWIGQEQIKYTGIAGGALTGAQRGFNSTEASSHSSGEAVKAEDNAILNSVFGFNVGQLVDTWGLFSFPIIFVNFFSHTVPRMIQGNIGDLFQGNGLGIIVDLWLVFGSGFVFMLAMALINARKVLT